MYAKGQVVSYQADNYAASNAFTSGTSFNPADWLRVGTAADTIPVASIAGMFEPWGCAFDAAGNLWVTSDQTLGVIYKIAPSTGGSVPLGTLSTPHTDARLRQGQGIVFDTSGNCFVSINSDATFGGTITKITPGGVISTFATIGTYPTNGLAGMAIDASNNLIVTDYNANTLWKVTPGGVVSSIATGLTTCIGVAIGPDGNYYVSGSGSTLWKVTTGGVVTTYATVASAAQGGVVFSAGGVCYVTVAAPVGLIRVPPGGKAYSKVSPPTWRPLQAIGLAIDSAGLLYTPEAQNGTLTVVQDGGSNTGDLTVWGRSKRLSGQVVATAPGTIPSGSVFTVVMHGAGWASLGYNGFYDAAVAANGILVPATGLYLFEYNIEIPITTGGSARVFWGAINGSDSSRLLQKSVAAPGASSAQNFCEVVSGVVSLTAGQYIELHAFQDSGLGIAIATSNSTPYMALTQIA